MSREEIKATLKSKGWTQLELADYWNVTPGWIFTLIRNDAGQRGVRDDCAFRGLANKNDVLNTGKGAK